MVYMKYADSDPLKVSTRQYLHTAQVAVRYQTQACDRSNYITRNTGTNWRNLVKEIHLLEYWQAYPRTTPLGNLFRIAGCSV